MSDSWKDNAGATRIGDRDRMRERVRKAGELEKKLHEAGYGKNVEQTIELANKYIYDKEDREKFIAIVEAIAINPDLVTEEQFTFYYDGHEYIDCADTAGWNDEQTPEGAVEWNLDLSDEE